MDNKRISLVSTTLFTVCSILVLDSFVAPAMIGVSSIFVWIIAALVFFVPYGLLSAELGSSFPDDGGIVSWVSLAFGEFAGVLVGWMFWISVAFAIPSEFTAFTGWLRMAIFPHMGLRLQAVIAFAMCWILGANEAFQGAGLDKRSRFLSHRHPRYGTSDNLCYLMCILSTVLIVFNFALSEDANDIFWAIFGFHSVVFLLNYLFLFPAAIKLKYSRPVPRSYEVPGGKTGMWICGVICFVTVALACWLLMDWNIGGYAFWMQSVGILLTIASGCWLYRSGKK